MLARLSWGHHRTIGCYLVLDNTALATLQAARTDTDAPNANPQFTAITAGGQYYAINAPARAYTCGITTDGAAQCWGGRGDIVHAKDSSI